MEMIASLMHKKQSRFPYTDYKFCSLNTQFGKQIVCICKNFTNFDIEFISGYEMINSLKKKNAISDFEHFINVCCQYGLDRNYVREFLEYQILTDFIITNVDRHYNNFGVLRNTDTLEFIDVAPIFDSGNSMFWNNHQIPVNNNLDNIKMSGFRNIEINLLKYVKNYNVIDLTVLPSDEEISSVLYEAGMNENDILSICLGYNKKIEIMKDRLCKG